MMRNLEIERVVLAAMAVGIARRSLHAMNSYASERKAFGSPLRDFGQARRILVFASLVHLGHISADSPVQMQRHIAESYAEYMAGKTYLYQTALNLDLDAAGTCLTWQTIHPPIFLGQLPRSVTAQCGTRCASVRLCVRAVDVAGNRLDTDGVKLFCTTMGKNVADRAMQVRASTWHCACRPAPSMHSPTY